ncbi:hypothetical protein JOE50_004017 [Bradyrhizobium japonicum]|nr:hypothetical protein [Bradyrhizobium japonicum]
MATILSSVIPGRDEVASPESIYPPPCCAMDSGLGPSGRPGMTAEG